MIYEPGFYEPEWAVSLYAVGQSHRITVTKSLRSIWIALAGWERLNPHWLERYEAGLVGTILALLGVFVLVVPE